MMKKKPILIAFILITGIMATIIGVSFYYTTVKQDDVLYQNTPFQKGMSFTTWGAFSFNSTEARNEILNMKSIGIEWVGVNIWWNQKNITSKTIYSGEWTDTAANITALFKFIHAQGMKVLFKPMLDSEDGIWRSYIEASPEWNLAYANFIKYACQIAQNGSVEIFSIGCEMGNWQVQEAEVEALIAELRLFYTGNLTYAANHDSFWFCNFWDKLDIIGIDAYFAFTLSYNPTLGDMVDVWDGFYDDLNVFQRRWNKPILFVELGCQNRDGCNIAPNDNKFSVSQDPLEFQMFYESLFQSQIWNASWFKGTYWWMWDCMTVNELTDIGFTPKLPVIQSTIHANYAVNRVITCPNYWVEFISLIVLGTLISSSAAYLVNKFTSSNEKKDKNLKKTTDSEKTNRTKPEKSDDLMKFILLNGTIFGILIFWAFTYYNQLLFNMIYSAVTKSVFLGEGVIVILTYILITLLSMVIIWIVLQRIVHDKLQKRAKSIPIIALLSAITIFMMEVFSNLTISNEFSITFYFTLQILVLLASLFTVSFIYGFPTQSFKNLKNDEKIALTFKIAFGTIAIMAVILIGLSLLLLSFSRLPSLLIGMMLIILIPILSSHFRTMDNAQEGTDLHALFQAKSFKENLKINQMKGIEALLVVFAVSYYMGILRFYDIHALINFNLTILPNFFIPIGFSMLVAIPMVIGMHSMMRPKLQMISSSLNSDKVSKNQLLLSLFKPMIYLSLLVLLACWWFDEISHEIALILGGIPLLMIFSIFLIGNLYSDEIFEKKDCWKRLTLYLIIGLTIGFTINGIAISLLYALTFLTIENGQIVVKVAFGEELGFDAIQLIYNIQLIISIIPIILTLIILKVIIPKMKMR